MGQVLSNVSFLNLQRRSRWRNMAWFPSGSCHTWEMRYTSHFAPFVPIYFPIQFVSIIPLLFSRMSRRFSGVFDLVLCTLVPIKTMKQAYPCYCSLRSPLKLQPIYSIYPLS
ncbi:hypothetical protein BJX99DRAFT_29650 [Aspergillus californicus]